MMTSAVNGIHFLVEGADDCKFWRTRTKSKITSIVNCEGRSNLLGASQIIVRQQLQNIAGVYDADFEHLLGVVHFPDILTPTDQNDLEITLVTSGALAALLHEFGDDALISDFQRKNGIQVPDYLEAATREFGRLRFLNHQLSHRVDFDRLSPYRFISQDYWKLDLDGLHAEYAKMIGISIENLRLLIEKIFLLHKNGDCAKGMIASVFWPRVYVK